VPQKDVYSVEEYRDLLKSHSGLERAFEYQLATLGHDLPAHKSNYSDWHPERNWAFDFAWLAYKVAVELDGGGHGVSIKCHNCKQEVRAMKGDGTPGKVIRYAGWHARPQRFLSDKDKFNEAQRLGWIALRFTNEDVVGDPFKTIQYLRGVLEARRVSMPMIEPLSKRELEVLHLIAGGWTTSDMAQRLGIAGATIRGHAQRITQKLNVRTRAAAVARGSAWGLIDFERVPWSEDPVDFLDN
jgi:DNA-binding CsgD family transcriptional regulator